MTGSYLPIALMAMAAAGAAAAFIALSAVLGRVRRSRTDLTPYECGMRPFEPSEGKRFSVKFYMVAMLFIIFDIETVFMIPWGASYRQLSCAVPLATGICPAGSVSFFGLVEMLVFMAILLVGFIYVWKKGALQWD